MQSCLTCGDQTKNAKYCSRKCANNGTAQKRSATARSKRTPNRCTNCGALIYGKTTRKYCDQSCMWAHRRKTPMFRLSSDELFVVSDGPVPSGGGGKYRERLIRDGHKKRQCERCKRTRWEGNPIPLELDHMNGDRRDNRVQNLRILCPNCHALTPNYGVKNSAKYKSRRQRPR